MDFTGPVAFLFGNEGAGLTAEVAARADRCWQAQPRWRTRWTRAGKAGNPAPLLMWFRHWTAAAAVCKGVQLPSLVAGSYALGIQEKPPAPRTPLKNTCKSQLPS